ncbi:hypothetical protein HK102_002038 [Quaeritorhiza haematococci]|nr:hypothetical protein HK102_002038 [Quaeritorhiza haematococci]
MTNQESVSPSCSLASSPSPSRSATTTSIGSSSSLASPDLSFRMEREDEIGSGFELPQVLQLLNEGEQHQNGLTSEIPSQTRGRIPISDDAKASGNLITAPDMPANSIAADDGAPYVQQNDANQHPQSHEEQGTGVAGHNDDGFGGLREKLGPVAVDGIVDVVGTDNVHNNTAPSDRDKEGTGHPPQKDAENENVPLGILALQVVQNSIMKVGVARLF